MNTRTIFVGAAIAMVWLGDWRPAEGNAGVLSQTAFLAGEQQTFGEEPDFIFLDAVGRLDGADQTFIAPGDESSRYSGLALLDGELLVADFGNDEIRKLTTSGDPAGVFASILNPVHLETDSSGSVYTTSGHLSSPSCCGPPNTVATRFDSTGAVTGQFMDNDLMHLAGIDADASGNVYIAHLGGELFKFAPSGTLIGVATFPGLEMSDVAIDETGNRLFAGSVLADVGIHVFDISGTLPTLMQTIPAPASPPFYSSTEIVGVHYDSSSQHLFATDGLNTRAHEFDENFNLIASFLTENNGDVLRDIVTLPVPTPSSLSLLSIAVVGAACLRYRR